MSGGEMVKLKIAAFKSSDFDDRKKVGEGTFTVQVNPTSYSIAYAVQYKNQAQAPGTSGYDPSWDKNAPRKMNFEFLFDGTGAIPLNNAAAKKEEERAKPDSPLGAMLKDLSKDLSVDLQIRQFEAIVFNVNGDIHAPNYLQINWGMLMFTCRLESMAINYKMFSREGKPLRAMIKASFIEVVPDGREAKRKKNRSPDITEVHLVKEGDKLPDLAELKYGDLNYYVAVAQANKLIQFRNLTAGDKIFLYPIQKTT